MDSKSKWLKPKMISWGFVALDLLCLIIQAVGISIWASEKSSGTPTVSVVKLGSWITVGGLGGQLVSFFLFTLLSAYIHRHPGNKYRSYREHTLLFYSVYGVILLISIRNVFRFVEFTQSAITYPDEGGVAENQTLFYCLETLPILLAFVVFIVLNPTYLLPKTSLDEYIEESSTTSIPGEFADTQDLEKADNSQSCEEEFSDVVLEE
jgi:Na+/melibiose symporter-like transporter